MDSILCERCKKRVVKAVGRAVTTCVCGMLVGALLVSESIAVPLEDMERLHRMYRDRGPVVLRVNAALLPESFHVSVTSSGDWTTQQVFQVATTSAVSKTFNLA